MTPRSLSRPFAPFCRWKRRREKLRKLGLGRVGFKQHTPSKPIKRTHACSAGLRDRRRVDRDPPHVVTLRPLAAWIVVATWTALVVAGVAAHCTAG